MEKKRKGGKEVERENRTRNLSEKWKEKVKNVRKNGVRKLKEI